MIVPFSDLRKQYKQIKNEIDSAISQVITSTDFIRGKFVEEFEGNFASETGTDHCIGVGNGTDALFIALKVLGIGPGDEVITTANTFIATAEAITMVGARPVFADCDSNTFTIDPERITEKITRKTKAIIPVHLYGLPAGMNAIMNIARKHNLHVIEDCSQAHLAEINMTGTGWKKVGSVGVIGTFSFYPGKNLGAYGDAGAIVTDNKDLALKMRMFSNHGRLSKYDHDFEGINSRMDGIQGAILNVKLKYLPAWISARRKIAQRYNQAFVNLPTYSCPEEPGERRHTYHLYVIKTAKRNELLKFLSRSGISAGIHYPKALPNLKAYSYLGYQRKDFPVAGQLEEEIISLPIFPELTEDQLEYVIEKLLEFSSGQN
jgi:dTDP-4-amino-4,6-dideoxygalactose transaminase